MKKFLYAIMPVILLSSSTQLQSDTSLDNFAHGLKAITDEANVSEKTIEKKELTEEELLVEDLLKALEKNDYTFLLNELDKEQYQINTIKNFKVKSKIPKDIVLAKSLTALRISRSLSLKKLALQLIDTYKNDGSIDFEWTYGEYGTLTQTPLLIATDINDYDIVSAVLSKGANPLKITRNDYEKYVSDKMPLINALENYAPKEIILALLKHVKKNEDIDIVIKERVVKNKNDVETGYKEITPLLAAAENKPDLEIVEELLTKDADPLKITTNYSAKEDSIKTQEFTPLTTLLDRLSRNKEKKEIVLKLISFITNPAISIVDTAQKNSGNSSVTLDPLYFAVNTDDLDIVQALLKKGANPNAQLVWEDNDKRGVITPLIRSFDKNNKAIITALINAVSNVDVEANEGFHNTKITTPLLMALDNNDIENTKLLLKKGANPLKEVGKNNTTALYKMFIKFDEFKPIVLDVLKTYKDKNKTLNINTVLYFGTTQITIADMIKKIQDKKIKEDIYALLK